MTYIQEIIFACLEKLMFIERQAECEDVVSWQSDTEQHSIETVHPESKRDRLHIHSLVTFSFKKCLNFLLENFI